MLTAENEMNCSLNLSTETNPSNVFVFVAFPVIFVVAIILPSFPPFCRLFLVTTRNIASQRQPLSQDRLNIRFWIAIKDVKIHH